MPDLQAHGGPGGANPGRLGAERGGFRGLDSLFFVVSRDVCRCVVACYLLMCI